MITVLMMIHMRMNSLANSTNARWIALVIVCLAQLMSLVDATIVNVALPSIQRSLHFSQANLTWVVNGYLISYGSFLLLAGRLGDLIGRRRTFLAGIALFTAASAACGIVEGQVALIAARFLQGLGGAGATSAIMAIITVEFPIPHERAKAMSVYILVVSCGGSIGLLAGGVITQLLDWHWIFFINVPVGAATFLLARRWVAENESPGIGRDVDAAGPVLVTTAMLLGTYAIVTSSRYGWGSAHTLGFGGAAVALLVAFVWLESRLANPIMPLRIFRVPGLPSSSLLRGLLITGMYATFFIGVLYLQHIRHYGVLKTGLAFLPQTILMGALSFRVTPRLLGRFGPKPLVIAGLALCAAGLALMLDFGADTNYFAVMLPSFALIGAGAALSMMPLLTIAMANVPPADAGMASGIVNTSLQLSGAVGVAVLATVAAEHTRSLLTGGDGARAALLAGYHLAFLVALGCAVVAVAASLVMIRGRRAPSSAPGAGTIPQPAAAGLSRSSSSAPSR